MLVRALVAADGTVEVTEVAATSGAGDLDKAAIAAVRLWRFEKRAQARAGRPLWVQVPIRFRLSAVGPE